MSRGSFEGRDLKSTDQAIAAFVIAPGAAALPQPIRGITLNGSGVLQYTSSFDGQNYTTATLPVGTYVLMASHILAGTTATDLTGWV